MRICSPLDAAVRVVVDADVLDVTRPPGPPIAEPWAVSWSFSVFPLPAPGFPVLVTEDLNFDSIENSSLGLEGGNRTGFKEVSCLIVLY